MSGKYKFRTSRLAKWALWQARLSIPVAILAFLLMRFAGVHPSIAIYCFAAAIVLALLSILTSWAAFPSIWFEGYRGGGSLWGAFLRSLVVLLPALAFGTFYFMKPAFSDLSTNPVDPPDFLYAWQMREDSDNTLAAASLAVREQQALAYPELNSRRIEQPLPLVHLVVSDELKGQKWELLSAEDYPENNENSLFEAHIRSIITGLRYVVSIRLRAVGEEATLVDMRSASLWGPHDLGANASRINKFLSAVNERLGKGLKRYELRVEEFERARRLQLGPLPRPKPKKKG